MSEHSTTAASTDGLFEGDAWFGPLEAGLRGRIRGFIEAMLEEPRNVPRPPYIDTCSNTARDCWMPKNRISIAGNSAPGMMIHITHPRWFGPSTYSGPSRVTPAQAPRCPRPSVQANAIDR